MKDSESDALPFNKSTVNAALASTESEAQRTSEAFGSAGVTNKVHEHIDTPWGGVDSVSSNDPNVRGSGMESTSEVGSSREVRYGSREAEIVEIGLRDSRGANTKLIEVHSRYEFYFRVRFNADIKASLGYGFIISNSRGIEIFATKAGLHGTALPPSLAGTIYECSFVTSVPIVPGTYFLSVAIAHEEEQAKGEFLDCRFDAFEFQIVGQTRAFTTCLVDLDVKLLQRRWMEASSKNGVGSWESR